MSGKKSKKTKGKTIPLQDFLGDIPGGVPTNPKMKSWADATEDDEDYGGYSTRKNDPVVLPTAPRAARDQSINEENIPRDPPYVAYISNLPYDVEEEDLNEFFAGMNIASMRLPKDANKFKGYGYIDFQDRESLIAALNMIDTTLKSRRVRIEVSNSSNDDRRGRMGRMGRDYGDDPERTSGDWRSARATDDNDDGGRDDRFRSRGFDRNREDRDSGFEDHKPTTGNWRDGPREAASDRPRPSFRESRPTGDDREWRGGGGGGGGGFGDRRGGPPRDGSRGREPGSGFGGRRYDDFERDKERWSSIRSQPRDSADAPSSDAPRMRPKLNLQPPSKPRENKDTTEEPSGRTADQPRSTTPTPATNIFGAAKPVDTAAREREIEERLAKSAEARREDDHDRRREGAWGRRNGEESDRSRPTWRSSQPPSRSDRDQRESRDSRDSRDSRESRDSNRDSRDSGEPTSDSRGTSGSRSEALPTSRASSRHNDSRPPPDGAEREKKKDPEEDELSRMPKAKEDQAPNFVASNKYSMLPDDVDPDNIEE